MFIRNDEVTEITTTANVATAAVPLGGVAPYKNFYDDVAKNSKKKKRKPHPLIRFGSLAQQYPHAVGWHAPNPYEKM